jgi:hypothetical protein
MGCLSQFFNFRPFCFASRNKTFNFAENFRTMKKNIPIILCMTLFSSIGMLSGQNVPNGDFEAWDTSSNNPTGWSSLNWTSQFGAPYTCSKSSSKHGGNYAMKLTTITFGTEIIDGIAFIGTWNNPTTDFPQFGYPYTKRPLKLKGYYKFSTTSNDSGLVAIRLTKWNSIKGSQDTIGGGVFFTTPVNTYTYFEIPITYDMSGMPDTASIIVLGSAETTFDQRGQAGNTLFIDDLSYELSTGVSEPVMAGNGLSVYPNPCTGYVTVSLPGPGPARLRVFDPIGREILCMQVETASAEIDLSAFPSGIYSIHAESQGTVLTGKFSKVD